MKKSWQTSEFWVTLITNVVGVAVLCGAINAETGQELGNALKSIAGAIISIATTLGYIKSRTEVKKARLDAIQESTYTSKEHDPDKAAKNRDHVIATIKKLGV